MTIAPNDLREARIILQNSMGHATAISIHNAKIENKSVDVAEVIKIAKMIAREVIKLGKEQ